MYFCEYYFEVGKTIIKIMFLGLILNNIEVSYNRIQSQIEKLEQGHKSAIRKLISVLSKTLKQMLYFLT